MPSKNLKREQEVFKDRRVWAKKFKVDEDAVEQVFDFIIKIVKRNHKAIKDTKAKK